MDFLEGVKCVLSVFSLSGLFSSCAILLFCTGFLLFTGSYFLVRRKERKLLVMNLLKVLTLGFVSAFVHYLTSSSETPVGFVFLAELNKNIGALSLPIEFVLVCFSSNMFVFAVTYSSAKTRTFVEKRDSSILDPRI